MIHTRRLLTACLVFAGLISGCGSATTSRTGDMQQVPPPDSKDSDP